MTSEAQQQADPVKPISQSLQAAISRASASSSPIHDAVAALRLSRQEAIRKFQRARGKRYHGARLENFHCTLNEQRHVVNLLEGFCWDIHQRFNEGSGVVFFGPCGTGKDHLMAAALYRVIVKCQIACQTPSGEDSLRCPEVLWTNGAMLFGDMRSSISTESEGSFIRKYANADMLAISDPLPPSGKLTEFQQSTLYRILDARYSCQRPTWATINVVSAEELDSRLGPTLSDRLRDGALALFCNWPSYRKVMG